MRADRDIISSHRVLLIGAALRGAMHGHNRQVFPTFMETDTITAGLTVIEWAHGLLEATKLSDEWLPQMGHRMLVLEAHHMMHIEGIWLILNQDGRLL